MKSNILRFTKKWYRAQNAEMSVTDGATQGLWTPTFDATDIILVQPSAEMANQSFEVTGLPAARDIVTTAGVLPVVNGNVVVFNYSGNVVAVLGA